MNSDGKTSFDGDNRLPSAQPASSYSYNGFPRFLELVNLFLLYCGHDVNLLCCHCVIVMNSDGKTNFDGDNRLPSAQNASSCPYRGLPRLLELVNLFPLYCGHDVKLLYCHCVIVMNSDGKTSFDGDNSLPSAQTAFSCPYRGLPRLLELVNLFPLYCGHDVNLLCCHCVIVLNSDGKTNFDGDNRLPSAQTASSYSYNGFPRFPELVNLFLLYCGHDGFDIGSSAVSPRCQTALLPLCHRHELRWQNKF
jgi:hypothetical protein